YLKNFKKKSNKKKALVKLGEYNLTQYRFRLTGVPPDRLERKLSFSGTGYKAYRT
ncbi:hypothetical protein LCGC14_1647810, partial [marine sediment metagenome]